MLFQRLHRSQDIYIAVIFRNNMLIGMLLIRKICFKQKQSRRPKVRALSGSYFVFISHDKATNEARQLQTESKGVDVLILWLDCDREGENICFEVIDIVKPRMKPSASIFRAKFSAVTKSDIDKAMANLGEPNKNEALSVDVRQELDLKVGVAFSRFQTKFFQGKYGDLDSTLVSYGPCQTPTLGFCVQRHDEIQQFQPEAFWVLDVTIKKNGDTIPLDWTRSRLFDQEVDTVLTPLRNFDLMQRDRRFACLKNLFPRIQHCWFKMLKNPIPPKLDRFH